MRAFPILLLVAAALLAGCSGGGSHTTPQQNDAGEYVIKTVPGNKFSPADAHVPVGATVQWLNTDGSPHDVVANDGSFDSRTQGKPTFGRNESYKHTFEQAGTWEYRCTIHSGMEGKITVE